MSATGTRAWSLTAALILLAQGLQETARGIGKTLADGATAVEQRLKAAGAESRTASEKLGKGARGFGESSWDSMKSVGRSVQRFFTGS